MAMKLSTGKVAFPLYFDNGDVENIMINPHDPHLQERIKNFEASIRERMKKINIEKYKDEFADDVSMENFDFSKMLDMSEEEIEKITKKADVVSKMDKEISKEFCDEIDSIFDDNVSAKAFKYVPPLAVVEDENGNFEMYMILVLKALMEEIQKYGNKMNGASNKYVAKYNKNK